MMGMWTRVPPMDELAGIAKGEKFISDGEEFTVHHVDTDGTVLAFRPLRDGENAERSYQYRTVERIGGTN